MNTLLEELGKTLFCDIDAVGNKWTMCHSHVAIARSCSYLAKTTLLWFVKTDDAYFMDCTWKNEHGIEWNTPQWIGWANCGKHYCEGKERFQRHMWTNNAYVRYWLICYRLDLGYVQRLWLWLFSRINGMKNIAFSRHLQTTISIWLDQKDKG